MSVSLSMGGVRLSVDPILAGIGFNPTPVSGRRWVMGGWEGSQGRLRLNSIRGLQFFPVHVNSGLSQYNLWSCGQCTDWLIRHMHIRSARFHASCSLRLLPPPSSIFKTDVF